jgi:hypothetical protein
VTDRLPEHLTERILTFPEHSHGAHLVDLLMSDGSIVESVHVAWGMSVVRVGETHGCRIDAGKAVDVRTRTEA